MPHSLADAIFWVAAVSCAIAQWLILRGALTVPDVPAAGAAVPAARRRAEVGWVAVPAVALALVLVATWRAIHPRAMSAPSQVAAPAGPEIGR